MTKPNIEQEAVREFKEKSKKLFTQGGLCVLLDYPPHEMVLDENEVEKFIVAHSHKLLASVREEVKGLKETPPPTTLQERNSVIDDVLDLLSTKLEK